MAARLGLKPKTLEEWRRKHCSPIPHYTIGGVVRYDPNDGDEYKAQQRVDPQQLPLHFEEK